MKQIAIIFGLAFVCTPAAFAMEQTMLARITVYWGQGTQQQAYWNGVRLRNGHCAVDPNKIPYGSKVVFPDGPCLAVDSGPAVTSRKAARLAGRTSAQRNAVVIDRYFESKKEALAWADAHPHFMNVHIVRPDSHSRPTESSAVVSRQLPNAQIEPTEEVMTPSPVENAQSGSSWPASLNCFSLCDIRGPLVPTFLALCPPRF